jgi:Ca2+-binding RTX toxin-like protein
MAIRTFNSKADFDSVRAMLAGDSGADTLSFAGASAQVLLADTDFLGMNSAVPTTNTRFEALVLSNYADQVTLAGNASNVGIVSVFGGTNNDRIDASAYTSTSNVTLSGGFGNDTLLGGNGADSLDGGAGNDSMVGGGGSDYYIVDSLSDSVVEGSSAGTDSVLTNANGVTLAANTEWLIFGSGVTSGTGSSNANTLLGSSNDDTLDGGAGADNLLGGGGNDYYIVDSK